MPALFARQYCDDYYGDCDDDPWYDYGRWILFGCIVAGAFLLFLAFSCITARRRRRMNMRPYPLTGWAYQGGPSQGYYQGQQQQPQYQNPPPAYNTATGGYYGNKGVTSPYGQANNQQTGVELQEPQSSYQPQREVDNVYQPPPGPPPGKDDGIIR